MKASLLPPKKARALASGQPEAGFENRRKGAAITAEALQSATVNRARFPRIASEAKGVVRIFNAGAECRPGSAAHEAMNQASPADNSGRRSTS